jgi:hypothetical protein
LRARRSRVRHSHEVGHRARDGARYPRLATKRVLSASEPTRQRATEIRIKGRGRTDTLTEPIKIWMSAHALAILQGLILISAANGAPVLFARLLGARFAHPIDGGIVLRDGHPLLGRSKTWRGLAAAVLLAACAAVLMSLPWQLGALAAASAMAGDCLSSFIKRRFGLEPSSMTLGLDQVPESLFPAVACSGYLPLGPLDVALIVLVFSVGELATSRLLFAIGLRDRPY